MDVMAAEARRHAAMGMAGMNLRAWGAADWASLFVMWSVMMVGMMALSALPVLLLFAGMRAQDGETEEALALTRHFKETVAARAGRDPAFREALLREGVEALLAGDVGTGKAVLRDYINATIGFEALAGATAAAPKGGRRG